MLAAHKLNMNCLELSKSVAYHIQEDLKTFSQIAREAFQGHCSSVLKSILALQLESKDTNAAPV